MVVRIHNTSKWRKIEPGEVLDLVGGRLRRVRVEVNCPEPTRFDVVEDGKATFLAVVEGYEVLEFTGGAADAVALVPTADSEVWFFTDDGDNVAYVSDSRSFVKIAVRQERNPVLEMMMFKMEQNSARRTAHLEAEIAALRAAQAEAAGADPDTGEVDEVGAAAGAGTAGAAAGGSAGAAEPAAAGSAGGSGAAA